MNISIKTVVKTALIGLLRGYRLVISPLFPPCCRYYPSCSAYALQAIRLHGPVRGGWLALRRLSKCHPWGPGGHDPVPARTSGSSLGLPPGEREGAPLPWNKRLRGAPASRGGCCMGDERGRATGEAEGAGCGALATKEPSAGECEGIPLATKSTGGRLS